MNTLNLVAGTSDNPLVLIVIVLLVCALVAVCTGYAGYSLTFWRGFGSWITSYWLYARHLWWLRRHRISQGTTMQCQHCGQYRVTRELFRDGFPYYVCHNCGSVMASDSEPGPKL